MAHPKIEREERIIELLENIQSLLLDVVNNTARPGVFTTIIGRDRESLLRPNPNAKPTVDKIKRA